MTNEVVVDTDAFSNLWQKTGNHQAYAQAIVGHIPVLSFATVAEARFGAAKKGWGARRVADLEEADPALRRRAIRRVDARPLGDTARAGLDAWAFPGTGQPDQRPVDRGHSNLLSSAATDRKPAPPRELPRPKPAHALAALRRDDERRTPGNCDAPWVPSAAEGLMPLDQRL